MSGGGGGGVRVRVRGSADARRAGVWVCLQEFRAAAQHAAALEHVASFCDNWDADEIGTVPHYLHWMRAGWNDTHTELSDVVVHVGRVLGSVRGMARELKEPEIKMLMRELENIVPTHRKGPESS